MLYQSIFIWFTCCLSVLSAYQEQTPVVGVRQQIELLRQTKIEEMKAAKQELNAAFDSTIAELKQNKRMRIDLQLSQLEKLVNDRDEFNAKMSLPRSPLMTRFKSAYSRAVKAANDSFIDSATQLAEKFRDAGDFDSAAEALSAAKAPKPIKVQLPQPAVDSMNGTEWDFLGVGKQQINNFKFNADGSVDAADHYPNAGWLRIGTDTILFLYDRKNIPESSGILFHAKGQDEMAGFHSGSGKPRYIRRKK